MTEHTTEQYETMHRDLMHLLNEMESWESFQNALNKTLPNDSDETDYDSWLEGSRKFAKDNEAVLKALVK